MKKIIVSLALLLLVGGCVTVPSDIENRPIYWSYAENPLSIERYAVTGKQNDLYYTGQLPDGLFNTKYIDRRLTNTPDVVETDIRVSVDKGYITYFAHDSNGGHWYMQPLGGDDSNRQEIDGPDSLKPKQIQVSSSTKISIADEISKFKQLLDSGAITKEEYEQKKNQLLDLRD